ncbi:AAA family ATPase [Rhodanobacter sp. FDAARGOS 1247]|uniref:AAA family ATPase n=1 Tax=Rhodanobacter sp. FDAARGOS 1247 TaxID=2778082 RepID=UPI001951BE4A|nr:AAA family ATPase [Rhodanobacter sp. FDAARGOS 1247]QRP64184.1 AAA family ATPase [Rhodanobacter sp. FDAARGOS 1247]
MAFSTDETVWDTFLAEWPLERLSTMTLADYTQAGDKHCFTNWMESGLDQYGSIWGGSAFKFGIYSRNDTKPKDGDTALAYDDSYGWYRRFGETHDLAFETVRREVVAVAEAARAGRLADIDKSELGPAYRWKIAFHYQNRSKPQLFPCVFMRRPLLFACALPDSDTVTPLSTLYGRAAELRSPDETLMSFSRRVWRDWVMATPLRIRLTEGAVRNGYIPINLVSAPFPESIRGGADESDAGEVVRFRTDTGWEFESDVRAPGSDSGRIRTRFNRYFDERHVQPGDVIEIQPDEDGVYRVSHYPKGGAPVVQSVAKAAPPVAVKEPVSEYAMMPTNRILFGPPGTGKTYRTVNEALRILDPVFLGVHERDRPALKQRFDAFVKSGQVRFVTFHQSFSYEDFVEGIRANTDETTDGLRYEVEDGVFKQICEAARSRNVAETGTGIDIAGRKIWKVSLGDASTEGHIFDECMREGVALLGFGSDADLSDVTSRSDIVERLRAAGEKVESTDYAVTALDLFVRRMQTGDLVVVTQGNLKFRAIGEVTGDYVHVDREGVDTYAQGRPVRWLRQYDPARPYADLMENRFSQMTIYELRSGSINMERLAALLAPEQAQLHQPEARVLIIDEINRGNISRIFGELITLVEPSKRDGCAEALEVTLPYSKERFSVPRNVHLIGTMNTADRSLAGLDVALRRRFEFVEMLPDIEALAGVVVAGVPVDALLSTMNRRIEVLLGRDYMLGHAYFMSLKGAPSLEALAGVFRRQVLPLLQEYFFEDWQKIAWVLNDHRKPAELQFLRQDSTGMSELLGDDVALPTEGRVWTINAAAFGKPEAYAAIIQAPQGAA